MPGALRGHRVHGSGVAVSAPDYDQLRWTRSAETERQTEREQGSPVCLYPEAGGAHRKAPEEDDR